MSTNFDDIIYCVYNWFKNINFFHDIDFVKHFLYLAGVELTLWKIPLILYYFLFTSVKDS